jgi:hypothetical protein
VLVELLDRNKFLKAATGAIMFGMDSSAWPAIWADAVIVGHTQQQLYEIAAMETTRKDAQRKK